MNTDNDILIGGLFIGGLVIFSFFSPQLASTLLALTSAYFLYSGFQALTTGTNGYYSGTSRRRSSTRKDSSEESIPQTSSAPINAGPTIAQRIQTAHEATEYKCPNCGATIKAATDRKCRHCESMLVDMSAVQLPDIWADIEVGQGVVFNHTELGEINSEVIHRVFYGELWQESMRKDIPWTLTGNYYVGLGLKNDMFLLNWQSRFFLLDKQSPITDMDINRDFARYAREYAASNQTKTVTFPYQNTKWSMMDIGRFRIEFTEGEGAIAEPGAIGRFIHSKSGNRILVVEDFQSGGGSRDVLWTGRTILRKDLKFL